MPEPDPLQQDPPRIWLVEGSIQTCRTEMLIDDLGRRRYVIDLELTGPDQPELHGLFEVLYREVRLAIGVAVDPQEPVDWRPNETIAEDYHAR